MLAHGKTPELLLILAIMQELDRETRQRIVDRLATRADVEGGDAAFEFARMTVMNCGESLYLGEAMKRLARGDSD